MMRVDSPLQAIRGMRDILPFETVYWRYLENILAEVAYGYGYREIRFPLVEQTALFKRGIGENTDIVEKEMYTFNDKNGDNLTLRPEGTAGCVRAGIEHGLFYNQTQRLWYVGPMFRHERPQKGRYRQFHQFGVEAFGISSVDIEAEVILLSARIWQALNLKDQIQLQLNSLGTSKSRSRYREQLISYFSSHQEELDEDSQRRLQTNPLRILDSKNPQMQSLIENAPSLANNLDEADSQAFLQLQSILTKAGISYTLNPRLVRGLDYYNGTVFEWITTTVGAQNAVCSGGRYDNLVNLLGGSQAVPAFGFGLGMERVLALLQQTKSLIDSNDIYIIAVGEEAQTMRFLLTEQWRHDFPNLCFLLHCGGGSFKNQFKRADKSGARLAFVLGSDEIATQTLTVKFLRDTKEQIRLLWSEVNNFLFTEFKPCTKV